MSDEEETPYLSTKETTGLWRSWRIPDSLTHKPVWLPQYPYPHGFPLNPFTFYKKKDVLDQLNEVEPVKRYYFFDTPDYADCHKKVYSYAAFGSKAAAVYAGLDVLAKKNLSYWDALGRAGGHFGRIGGSFVMYAAVTCFVANFRGQKHDTWEHPFNHMIGGASVGLIWGYKFRSTSMGALVAAAGALFGILNLRANTPTKNHPTGWVINFPDNIEEVREDNAAIGGQGIRSHDWRFHYKTTDPGRKSLE